MSDVENKKTSELSNNSQEHLLPFPPTRPDSELIGNSKSSDDSSIKHTGAKQPLPRRTRAGTMPSSFNASPLVYIPPNRGQGSIYQGQRSAELPHAPNQNSTAHILRNRGSTLSGSSLNSGFGSSILTSWRDLRGPLSSKPLVSLDESEQSIARTLDCLGLDDPEPSQHPPQPQGVAALRNANRVRSRTFTAALHYAESPVNAVPAPPAQKRTVYPKSYNRARAISMGFLDPTDSIPELDAIMGEDDDGYDFFDSYDHDNEGYSPSRALWIGNLDPAFGSADLMALFAPYGPIESLRVIPEKECAFINFMHLEDAVMAKEDLSGGTIGNNVIRIGFSRVDAAIGDMQASAPTRALWIGNISASTSSAMLQTIFSNFGAVESARVLSHKSCGFVNFERTEDAVKARKAMNGQEISGAVVRIGFAKVPPRGESGSKANRAIPAIPLSVMGIPSAPWSSDDVANVEEAKVVSPTTVSPTVRFAPDLNGDDGLSITDKGLLLSLDDKLLAFPYASQLPPLPDSSYVKLDQARLREIRKKLDSHPNPRDIENAFAELDNVFVELCTDYIGNTVIQKLMDKGNDAQRLRLIEKVAPYLAPIGVHKNGTWAVQKIIDSATTPAQIFPIINSLKPFVPPLMLDQFGNYVIQGCLKYGAEYNQFIYEAIHSRCWEICQGRFGARAVRTCLESNHVTKRQQRLVSVALAHHALLLSTDPNGSLLLTWLLDTSNTHGRFQALVPQFSLHLPQLCTHKLATLPILKIINQRFEPDARNELVKQLFFVSDSVLEIVLGDQAHGMGLIQKILASACIEDDERDKIVERVREAAIKLELHQIQGYHRFMEELGVPTSPNALHWQSTTLSTNNGTSPDTSNLKSSKQAQGV